MARFVKERIESLVVEKASLDQRIFHFESLLSNPVLLDEHKVFYVSLKATDTLRSEGIATEIRKLQCVLEEEEEANRLRMENEKLQQQLKEAKKEARSVKKELKEAKRYRGIPADYERCMARTFDEKEHVIGGQLVQMRDDIANLYGGRCKFTKTHGDFCGHHKENQAFGVWDGEYRSRLGKAVEEQAMLRNNLKN